MSSSVSLWPPGYSASSPGCGYEVAFSGPIPKSRSPHGIQFDSPLQRQWMIRSSSGRLALKAATVCGASSSSHRATKRIPAATISNTPENLPEHDRDRDDARRGDAEDRPDVQPAQPQVEVVAHERADRHQRYERDPAVRV